MYQLMFYVPESHLEQVKDSLFKIGAGKIGAYSHCAWQTKGVGQFQPNEHSNPFIGDVNTICKQVEFKVEMVCQDELLKLVLKTLCDNHPYDEPAYAAFKITTAHDVSSAVT